MSNSLTLQPVPLSPSHGTVELSSLASPQHSLSPPSSTSVSFCLGSCWKVISWTFSVVAYIIELFVYVWVAYIYAKSGFSQKYYLFGLSIGFLVLPTVVIASISLVWYYNLDRFHRQRRERDPHNMEFIEYRKKFTFCTLLLHVLLLGVVYRYSQLIYLTLIGKSNNLPYLHRDAILVRFFHSFLSSAPHIVIHLYATIVALFPASNADAFLIDPLSPAVLSALAISIVSVIYTTLSFATNDRVSGKNRRVILSAHLTQMLWYLCMIVSRVLAFAVFAYVFGYYVLAVVGGHYLVMAFLLLLQRTTFCADIERQSSGELRFTRRMCLEIPFDLLAAAVYVFAYFNPKRGRTRVWAGVYHLMTLAENVTMGALFYVNAPSSPTFPFFSLISLTLVVGLYPVGLMFMFCYYLLYHPKRSENCYWVGVPRNCRCCSRGRRHSNKHEVVGTKYEHRNSRIIISEPTLVSHNGFVPRNLLPVGPNAVTISNQNEVEVVQADSYSQSVSMPNGHVRRDRSLMEPAARRNDGNTGLQYNRAEQDLVTSLAIGSPNSSRNNTGHTASESNPAFSDTLQSELDTDLSSNVVETHDTVIDTPLFGSTPETTVPVVPDNRLMRTRIISPDTESQKTCTNDTGIDVDSDLQLSPGTPGTMNMDYMDGVRGVALPEGSRDDNVDKEREELRLPVFVDVNVPAKQWNYRHGLEQHYFPDDVAVHADQPSQEPPHQNRDSVTPTLPTPTYSPSPKSLTPSSTRAQWRHLSEESEDVFHHDNSPQTFRRDPAHGTTHSDGSQTSPERPKKAPRSPIGARAHQITLDDLEASGSQNSHTSSIGPSAVTPRSPKGARRLLIQHHPPGPGESAATGGITLSSLPRRQAPPIPPKTKNQDPDILSESLPITSSTTATGTTQASPRRAPPLPPSASPKAAPSDGLTRGLLSLVPASTSERRAQSSSPYPTPRQQVVQLPKVNMPGAGRNYPRPVSHNPHQHSPERLPRVVTNYSRVSGQVQSGSVHSMQYYHPQQRPKSDGWRDRNAAIQMLQNASQKGRPAYPQVSLNSSPERTPHNNSSSDQKFVSGREAYRKHSSTRPNPQSNAYYSPHVPNSAFSRVSPERSHAHHVGRAGPRHSQRPHLSESYPAAQPTGISSPGSNMYPPPKSPRHYPKAPQGASVPPMASPPKMIRSAPLPKRMVPGHVPPPLPPPRQQDHSIDEPLTDLTSSSRTHSLGGTSSSKHSGNYDRLPAEIGSGEGVAMHVGRANRKSSTPLHPPKSSTHESIV